MENLDIRWKQRFANYCKALSLLNDAAGIVSQSLNNYGSDVKNLQQEGLIQRFEYTHELAWNVMKDYAEFQGNTEIRGSRDAIRYALSTNLVEDRKWMKTIEDRNQSSHHYDEATAEALLTKIIGDYLPLFNHFEETMKKLNPIRALHIPNHR